MIYSIKPALRLAFAAVLSGVFLAPMGNAQAGGSKPTGGEIRVGAAYHGYASAESGTVDVSVDALLPAFDLGKPLSGDAFSLHPEIGVDLNTQGKTNAAFAGFAAVVRLPANFKIEADLGGSVNDGKKTSESGSGRSELGCNALFREAFGIGYQITSDVSVMAFAEHMSNANLCLPNNGITNFGLKLGYAF
jgi:hypothetical protein